MIVHCLKCSHQWDVEMTLPMDLDKFAARAKRIAADGCPSCKSTDANTVCVGPAPSKDGSQS